ncbi:hypothetical protein [Nocardia araoensis]|nr:hypothetical protein [Nocardia araoensis]
MSAMIMVVAFVCCALAIRALAGREQAPTPLPVAVETDDAWR